MEKLLPTHFGFDLHLMSDEKPDTCWYTYKDHPGLLKRTGRIWQYSLSKHRTLLVQNLEDVETFFKGSIIQQDIEAEIRRYKIKKVME